MIMAECSVNFPVIGLITRLQELIGYRALQKNVRLGRPENTSLFRATAFKKTNVMEFFDSYECALKSWKFLADRVYNIDETGLCTRNYDYLMYDHQFCW
jgi:hypothetical protein